jgi:hypothetical protein
MIIENTSRPNVNCNDAPTRSTRRLDHPSRRAAQTPPRQKYTYTHRVYEIKRPRARIHGTYLPWGRAALTLLSARLQEKEERARAKDIPL